MRVPFIVSWAKPRKGNKFQKRLPIEVGGMQSQLGTIMDIYPTVLSVAGCKLPADYVIDGFDLKKQLSGKVNRCMALEDSRNGLLSAIRAGLKAVMIPDQWQPDDEIQALLYAKCGRLDEVIGLLEKEKTG